MKKIITRESIVWFVIFGIIAAVIYGIFVGLRIANYPIG